MSQPSSLSIGPTLVFYAGLVAVIVATMRIVRYEPSPLDLAWLAGGVGAIALSIWLAWRRRRA